MRAPATQFLGTRSQFCLLTFSICFNTTHYPLTMTNVDEVKALNQKLLLAVSTGDWDTYKTLCAEDISCFEPETAGQVMEGLRKFEIT